MGRELTETQVKLIKATLKIIESEGDIDSITVRKIAQLADVGIGTINYHFDSKDNLINLAIQYASKNKSEQLVLKFRGLEMAPKEKIKCLFTFIADKMIENPEHSNIAFYNDFFNEFSSQDNSLIIHNYLITLLQEIYPELDNQTKLHLMAHQIGSSLQTLFLRNDVFKNNFGIDINDDEQRKELVELLVDNIIS